MNLSSKTCEIKRFGNPDDVNVSLLLIEGGNRELCDGEWTSTNQDTSSNAEGKRTRLEQPGPPAPCCRTHSAPEKCVCKRRSTAEVARTIIYIDTTKYFVRLVRLV